MARALCPRCVPKAALFALPAIIGRVEPYDQNVTFDAMFTGYAQAFTRFHGAAVGRDAAGAFIPLFEALNWAATLDWRIGAQWVPAGRPLRDRWPDHLGDAHLVYGVRYARNGIHHQWSDALRIKQGAQFPIRFPAAFFEWVWCSASELPAPEAGRRKDEKGEAAYIAQLEARPARHALENLGAIFDELRGLMEPSLLRRQPTPAVVTTE